MPRRDTYLTDDDDDTPRRAAASGGGGVPGWVWVLGGGGALAAVLVLGLGFFAVSRREAAVRHEADFARADMMRAEAQAMRVQADHDDKATEGLPELSLARIANAYKKDRADADARYINKRLLVRFEVTMTGPDWVGAAADLGDGLPNDVVVNVMFMLEPRVEAGTTIRVEGDCLGLVGDPNARRTLAFGNCRVVRN